MLNFFEYRLLSAAALLLCCVAFVSNCQAEEPAGPALLSDARQALAVRDLATAEQKLKEAEALGGEEAFQAEVSRLQSLWQMTGEFWKSVLDGAKTLNATEELLIGETRTAIVEFDGNVLILRVNGKNVRYNRQSVPAKVALTLAERVLKPDDPQNKAILGAFLLVDGKGSRELAGKYLREAQQAGVDVKDLLPELEVSPTIVIDIPAMTPLMQRVLTPMSWTRLTTSGERISRDPLGKESQINEDGRLVVLLPADTPAAQIVFGRRFAGDFRCRMILECSSAGQRFGLFSSTEVGESFSVKLPAGQIKADLVRQGSELKCELNGAPAKLESVAGVRPRMGGMLGIELQPGQSCTIQWVEIAGK